MAPWGRRHIVGSPERSYCITSCAFGHDDLLDSLTLSTYPHAHEVLLPGSLSVHDRPGSRLYVKIPPLHTEAHGWTPRTGFANQTTR